MDLSVLEIDLGCSSRIFREANAGLQAGMSTEKRHSNGEPPESGLLSAKS